jgi:uncharacterized membrane protein
MGFIAFILALFIWWQLSNRISRLEDRLRNQPSHRELPEDVPMTPGQPVAPRDQFMPIPHANPVNSYSYNQPLATEPSSNAFINWLKEDFLVKLGGFLVLLAVGWFVSYAFAENWIGPIGRITLGILLGVSVMTFGVFRMQKYARQGGIFTVLGGVIVIMTLFAAREIYDFFTPATALGLMFLTVLFLALVSVKYRLESMAIASLVIGSISPLLTDSPSPDTVGLFSYLLVMTLGTLAVVWGTGWTRLILISLIFTFLYTTAFLTSSAADRSTILLFTFLFVGIYYVANLVSMVRRREVEMQHLTTHISTAIGTAVFLVVWVENTSLQEWKSLLYSAWAVVFALGTYVIFLYTANRPAFYLYGAVALGLVGIATASELSGPALTIAYLLEIGLIFMVARQLRASVSTQQYLASLMVIPFVLSLESLAAPEWRTGIMHSDFVVLVLTFSIFTMIGLILKYASREPEETKLLSHLFLGTASFYGIALVWLVTHALFTEGLAITLSLTIYTVFGLVFYIIGRNQALPNLRYLGTTLIGIVVLRLLFVDVWELSLEGRIVTFLIIGVLLISTAFMGKKDRLAGNDN